MMYLETTHSPEAGIQQGTRQRDPFLLHEPLAVSKWVEPSRAQRPERQTASLVDPILGGRVGVWECLQEEVTLELRP